LTVLSWPQASTIRLSHPIIAYRNQSKHEEKPHLSEAKQVTNVGIHCKQ